MRTMSLMPMRELHQRWGFFTMGQLWTGLGTPLPQAQLRDSAAGGNPA